MASLTNVAASTDNPSRHRSDIFMYLLSAISLTLLLYAIHKILLRCFRQFCHYHMTTYFYCMHGHDKGPSAAVVIELSNLSEITHVHIAHINVPITLLFVHDTDHRDYHIVLGNWLYDFLKISKLIILIHRDGLIPIRTPNTFEIGLFQPFKLR